MVEITEKNLITADMPESQDADYLAWVNAKIAQGMADLKDPAKRVSEKDVWDSFGFGD